VPKRMPKNGLKFKSDENLDQNALIACGRLADARRWFQYRDWKTLPKDDRLQPILKWGADHAYLACPTNPPRSVRRWCRKWAPWLTAAELGQIIAYTKTSNKRWAHDQCATVLGITVRDRQKLNLRFIGANDDPDYQVRSGIKRAKAAERSRRHRAKHSTGAKRGRPKSEGLKPWEVIGISRRTYYRQRSCENGTKNASRDINNNRKRYGISVPPGIPAACECAFGAPAYRPKRRSTSAALLVQSKLESRIPAKGKAKQAKRIRAKRIGKQTNESLVGQPIERGSIIDADFLDELLIGNREPADRKRKTRIRSTFRPTRRQREIAAELGIPPGSVGNLFHEFTCHYLATGAYSADWDEAWRKYVATSEEIHARWRATSRATAEADRSYIDPRL
jgi:hypothetical protein